MNLFPLTTDQCLRVVALYLAKGDISDAIINFKWMKDGTF